MLADRRNVIRMMGLAMGVGLAGGLSLPRSAFAIAPDAAKAHVRSAVDQLLALARAPGPVDQKADRFENIMQQTAALPQIARFAAGRVWRDMSEAQQQKFVSAFSHYVSHVYAGRFQDYAGQTVKIGSVEDQGPRGVLVNSQVVGGNQPVNVQWLVTDQPGHPVIADIIIEGVSMLITQRDEIAGLYQREGNSVDKLISFLADIGVRSAPPA